MFKILFKLAVSSKQENLKLPQKSLWTLVAVVIFACQFACDSPPESSITTNLVEQPTIPKPVSVSATNQAFVLNENTDIYVQGSSEALANAAQYLADKLNPSTGLNVKVISTEAAPDAGHIFLDASASDDQLGEEGYVLEITAANVSLHANSTEGVFRGIQTLRQLLPSGLEAQTSQERPWYIATGTIRDYPEYAYRGVMLDVARHFFSPQEVKDYIDQVAYYKFNHLHLHLSDDQGWRIEIKSWPELTNVGSSTAVGGGEGGFFTQEEYADIVAYAQERHITIVPEIDMPGHTNAALASYSELNCDNKAPEMYTGIEVGFSTLCVDKEITYQFVDDVVREIAALTPGPHFHIGGDESHVTPEDDYIKFINRAQEIVRSHGKQVMGWDEIANAELVEGTVVQHWADVENAQKAVEQGAKVLMSPAVHAYMDMKYDSTTELGLSWAAYVEVDSAYLWDLSEVAEGVSQEDIIGVEAPLWTETITNPDDLEYMVFPRVLGYAEIGWTAPKTRNWEEYRERLAAHSEYLEAMDINYYRSQLIPWPSGHP